MLFKISLSSLACVMLFGAMLTPKGQTQEPKTPVKGLTREEARLIRSAIYNDGLCTHIRTDTLFPHREIDIRIDIAEIHKKHRVETLKLLLDIVKGGRPEDARAAGGTALALEEGGVIHVMIADWDNDYIDQGNKKRKGSHTGREVLTDYVTQVVAKAEREVSK